MMQTNLVKSESIWILQLVDKSLTLSFKGMVIWHLLPQPTPVEARLQSCIVGNPRLIMRLMDRGTMRNQPWVSNNDKVADWILFKKN